MCGLFGFTLPHLYPRRDQLWSALRGLGCHAVERGQDSCGLAITPTRRARATILRRLGRFDQTLAQQDHLSDLITQAGTVIGHTRAATQGAITRANTSPLLIDDLLGTHNGDVDIDSIPHVTSRTGETDTAALLRALAACATGGAVDVGAVREVLTQTRGRAALAWQWLHSTDQVWLARAALSPLAIGFDDGGGLWWASNPGWLRGLAPFIDLKSTFMVPEGHLLTLHREGQRVRREAHTFDAQSRWIDQHRLGAVWRGFTPADIDRDRIGVRSILI